MTRSAWLRWLLGLALSGLFLWLVFRGLNLAEVGRVIVSASPLALVPIVASMLAASALRVIRWQLCFEKTDGVTFRRALAAYSLGSASVQVIPARLGDLVRVYVLGQTSAVSKSKGLGTLVVERLSDLFTVVILLAAMAPLLPLPGWIKLGDAFAAALALLALVVVYLLARHSATLRQPGWVAGRRWTRAAFRLLVQVLAGFSAVRSPRRALAILAVSAALWVFQVASYALAFPAVHLSLGWKAGALLTGVLALSTIIPAGPGFAGSFEIAGAGVLALFGVDRAVAIGYLEYTRIATLLAVLLFGAAGLIALKLAGPAPQPATEAELAGPALGF